MNFTPDDLTTWASAAGAAIAVLTAAAWKAAPTWKKIKTSLGMDREQTTVHDLATEIKTLIEKQGLDLIEVKNAVFNQNRRIEDVENKVIVLQKRHDVLDCQAQERKVATK